MLDLLASFDAWAALLSLTALEIVLGIDNVVFISILVGRLDERRGRYARRIGLALALLFRIALLYALTALMALRATALTLWGETISWHELILVAGGLFLIAKAVHEMHAEIDPAGSGESAGAGVAAAARASLAFVIGQIIVIDVVFSLDSILTAIGMAQDIRIMIAAVLIAIGVMYWASGSVAHFIAAHPTTRMLALAFLVLIGVALVADGFDFHIPRGYIYFAMAFAAAVEAFNIWAARNRRRRDQDKKT
jgi:predicted tellurium resistance membrane protein TerC